MDIKQLFEDKRILDRLTAYIGNYIARHNNKNIINDKYNTITEIDNIISNISSTIELTQDDPVLTAKLKEYKIKKEEEKDRLLNTLMYDIIPEPETLNASDYKRVSGSCGTPDKLVRIKPSDKEIKHKPLQLSDIFENIMSDDIVPMKDLCDIVNSPKNNTASYQEECDEDIDEKSCYFSGCGSALPKKKQSSGGCGCDVDDEDDEYDDDDEEYYSGHC